jgi:DNA (cytosine-5)-methyltransferase 1
MIASCPGEVLPKMPLPTHSENGAGGLKPWATVNEAISGLQVNAHNDSDFKVFDADRQKSPYDGNQPLKGTITTNGGEVCHPSGTRKFTYRELAALQGFPSEHIFTGFKTQKTKQIGNAVPPIIAKVLCESIIKELKQADGIIDDEDYIAID